MYSGYVFAQNLHDVKDGLHKTEFTVSMWYKSDILPILGGYTLLDCLHSTAPQVNRLAEYI